MLVVLGVLSAVALLWFARHGRPGWPKRLAPAAALLLLGSAFLVGPQGHLLSKSVGRLLMPLGLLWLGLLSAAVVAAWHRRPRLSLGLSLLCVLLTLAGNGPLSDLAYADLEGRHGWSRPLREGEPFDAVIVLGGGTAGTRRGEPQLGQSGDRVLLGARLYHAGRTPLLLTSGDPIAGLSAHDAGRATSQIWRSLQVPRDAIEVVPGAQTTSEEARVHAARAREAGWDRVGLVTSAWHLPRALARFEEEGLRPTPLPADVRGHAWRWRGLFDLIPIAPAAAGLHQVAWEHLGRAFGR